MADTAKSATIGLISNAKFTIAGIDLSLQVHVVRQAPFQALLGRSFFAVTECKTKDCTSGDQHIMLSDPNNRNHHSKVATGIQNMLQNMLQQGFQRTSRN
ncbi:hypothetical protein ACEPAG_8446 [Sanghuangporus baumii]